MGSIAVLLVGSLVRAEPDYSASYEEFLAKFGKGYADQEEHVSTKYGVRITYTLKKF